MSTKKDDATKERGVFERPRGSDIWWVRYADQNGRVHREKVGPRSLARKVYHKRKTEVREHRFFPEQLRRREVLLKEMVDDYLKRVEGILRSYRDYERYGGYWVKGLGNKPLRQICRATSSATWPCA